MNKIASTLAAHRSPGKYTVGRPRGVLALAVRRYRVTLAVLLRVDWKITRAEIAAGCKEEGAAERVAAFVPVYNCLVDATQDAAEQLRRVLFAAPLGVQRDSRGRVSVETGCYGSRSVTISGAQVDGPYWGVTLYPVPHRGDTHYLERR